MKQVIVLDSGPLGMVTNPRATGETKACNRWLQTLLTKGVLVYVPEIADYEVRRELLRANKNEGIRRLDQLQQTIRYLPITTDVMRKAAEFWATVRKQGKSTADDKHLSLFAQAKLWSDIK
jgi:predicted nucleic acid-binding protein